MKLTLKDFMEEKNISANEIAETLGKTKELVRGMCRGSYSISKNTRKILLDVYGLDVIDLYVKNDEKKNEEKTVIPELPKEEKKIEIQNVQIKEEKNEIKNINKGEKNMTMNNDIFKIINNEKNKGVSLDKQTEDLLNKLAKAKQEKEINVLKLGLLNAYASKDEFFLRKDVADCINKIVELSKGYEKENEIHDETEKTKEQLETVEEEFEIKENQIEYNFDDALDLEEKNEEVLEDNSNDTFNSYTLNNEVEINENSYEGYDDDDIIDDFSNEDFSEDNEEYPEEYEYESEEFLEEEEFDYYENQFYDGEDD